MADFYEYTPATEKADLRERALRLTHIGKYYRDNYKTVRVDAKTVKLVKK